MQPREKLLATALAVTLAIFLLRPDRMLMEPLHSRDATIKSAANIVQSLEDRELDLMIAERRLADYRSRSLPPLPVDAQREYSEWLTDLALLSNWRNPQVTLGSRTPRERATMIPITVKAQATLDDVNQFLQQFDETKLFHRVANLKLECSSFEGNPPLQVELTAEGVAVSTAMPRTRLFPTAELANEIDADDTAITLDNTEGFPPEAPFFARVEHELLEVESITDDNWTVARGVAGTLSVDHPRQAPVELLPTQPVGDSARPLPDVQRLFVRAQDDGELQLTAQLTPAVRGRPWTAPLNIRNWDPALGQPEFRLQTGAPDGMTLDAAENNLVWTPPRNFPLGPIDIQVAALGSNASEPVIESDLSIEVRRPNNPPRLTIPDEVDVWLGRPWQYELSAADDDGPDDALTFAISGNVPPGLEINGETGVINWSPPADRDLGEFDAEITVTDSGQPPESDTRTLTLRLADDNALYTYLTGTIRSGSEWEAWLYDRSTNRMTVIRTGQEFQIADITGKPLHIDENSMEIESAGRTYRLQMGQNLRNWTPAEDTLNPATSDGFRSSGESAGTVRRPVSSPGP